ncbi:MAG: serpin family protein [bacterium]|nr:serpin family protein [bacterium]
MFMTSVFALPGVATALPSLSDSELDVHDEYDGVTFPMVSYDQQVDISWLRGLHTTGDDELPAIIVQALQQTRFRMNDVGARAESAVAFGMTRSMSMERPKPELIINEPFLCWIRRPNCRLPLFVGYFDTDSWKDPGSLGR